MSECDLSKCECGSEFFVHWLPDQQRYSSATPRACFDKDEHLRACCLECNRDVVTTHNDQVDAPS